MRKTVYRQYLHFTPDEVFPAKTYGEYFPELFADPHKYIVNQTDFTEVIQKLRNQGKFVFLATNSHWEYMELIMGATLG